MAYNEKKHLYIDCCFHILNFALGTSFTDALIMACLVPPRFNKSCFVNIFPFSLSLYVIVHDPRRLVQAAFLALMTEFCILVFRVSDFQFSYKFHNFFFFKILRDKAILDIEINVFVRADFSGFLFLIQSSERYFLQLANAPRIFFFFLLGLSSCFGLCLKDISPFTSFCFLALLQL